MRLFYTDKIEDNLAFFSPEETRHIAKSMRLSLGDKIFFSDGKGSFFHGIIQHISRKECVATIEKKKKVEAEENLTLAVALSKNNSRYEWMIEKCTEMGTAVFIPFFSEHSERKAMKKERLEKVLTAACKQSLKAFRPELKDLITFKELIMQPFEGNKYIAHCHEAANKKPFFKSYIPHEKCLVLIGPEGGFSLDEINIAEENGFESVGLGKNRLRMETAAVASCHTTHILNQMYKSK